MGALRLLTGDTAGAVSPDAPLHQLMRPGIRRYFERHGYRYHRRSRRGLDLWLATFDGPHP